jgi:ABC-2 type transport system ATP-binding protein
MEDNVVEINDLTRTFGQSKALDAVTLNIPQGQVVGLVGQNGAGKTTLIKHILGLYRAEKGAVRVFGLDPVSNPPNVLSRIGYLSEEGDLPTWMRVDELIRYSSAFYPRWDADYARSLVDHFELDPSARLSSLSKGQRARAALLVALAYRPDLLVLDEPSSGLDPLVRRDILAAIIRTIADEGRTVLFSSHLLSEVEQVTDRIAMIKQGRIVLDDTLDRVKLGHFRADISFLAPRSEQPDIPGALYWQGAGTHWSVLFGGTPSQLEEALAKISGRLVVQAGASLEDIFIGHAGGAIKP